jgi:YVTN family beta-propeller protein
MPVGLAPTGIAITPNGATAYVADFAGNAVSPINTATNAAGTPIRVARGPGLLAITPDGVTAYVTSRSGSVSLINTATNTTGTFIRLGAGPDAIAITPDQAPVAHLNVTPAKAGNPTSFDALASSVRYGTIALYVWNFGDGTHARTKTPSATHVYASGGGYTTSVTETSSAGTSTQLVFTGQTVSNNGGPSAVATARVIVPPSIAIAGSYTMTLTTPGGTRYAYAFTISPTGTWSIAGQTGTSAIVAQGIVRRDPVSGGWLFTQTEPAASSHFTATASNEELTGSWFPTGGAVQVFQAVLMP